MMVRCVKCIVYAWCPLLKFWLGRSRIIADYGVFVFQVEETGEWFRKWLGKFSFDENTVILKRYVTL
jgi:hypothetical protein